MSQSLATAAVRLEAACDAYRSGTDADAREELQLAVGALEREDLPATAGLVVELADERSQIRKREALEQLAGLCASWAHQREVAA